jgi:hypothetical protein
VVANNCGKHQSGGPQQVISNWLAQARANYGEGRFLPKRLVFSPEIFVSGHALVTTPALVPSAVIE